ncbi:Dipeptidyl carboxypeptidase Dcp [Enhygromyxa salina]|uniref:Dipeptidyl carboxypeptidase Dcp n=1 Tax=Enhygromyxa salina TaxID=215803 RepID=A0A0C2A5C5_9BACT|nr:M3 family metallopeptidase [Enhygromyxa salina]KIG18643.1 Dipeptidyl carboxypeptidase Dcp [Enhygromyxa salina]
MRTSSLVPLFAGALLLSACAHDPVPDPQPQLTDGPKETPVQDDNPLFTASTLQYQAPDFAAIELDHFRPAFERGMEEHTAEIEAIANAAEPASFDNTLVAMERSGELIERTASVFFSLTGTVSNEGLRTLQSELAPLLSAHADSITLNPKLFARVEAVYQARDQLSGEDKRLAEEVYARFVRAGAKLDEAAKVQIREINSELSKLTTDFSQNLLAASTNSAVIVEDVAELAGLSEADIKGLAAAATEAGHEGKYLINLLNTTRQPVLSSLENRALRQRVWEASAQRGVADNGPALLRIVELRAAKAKLLGYPTWAAYVLEEQMAKTPQAVLKILDDLAPKAAAKAKAEAQQIQKAIKADKAKAGGNFEVQAWDWAYYAEKVRAKQFDLDEAEIRAYFELENVLQNGLFFTMGKLYGIRFEERKDLPVYHPDVRTFEVFEEDGTSIGLFYADYYAREGKRGGAWMNAIVPQTKLLGRKPVIVNVLNIPKPAKGEPTLLTFAEATTMFHEMGHGVHGLFSDAVYPSLAGTSVPRDYVEFPSQFEEDWLIDPLVISNVAKHYETGEPIPKPLLDKLLASRKFNQGFDSLEYLGAALLDMEWHLISSGAAISDAAAFEEQALTKHGVNYAPVPPRYKSTFFAHTFAGGYSAGYYAYLWTEVLAADAFAYMGTQGGLTRANGDKFRELILSKGNTVDPMAQYVSYRGQEPTVDALLKRRGLVGE